MGPSRLITIGADHASLAGAGHFPGHPVVPGVVMLGEILHVIRKMIEFVGIPSAKFLSPLSPGEPLTITLDKQDDEYLEFTCTTGSRLIANGGLCYRMVACNSPGDS